MVKNILFFFYKKIFLKPMKLGYVLTFSLDKLNQWITNENLSQWSSLGGAEVIDRQLRNMHQSLAI